MNISGGIPGTVTESIANQKDWGVQETLRRSSRL